MKCEDAVGDLTSLALGQVTRKPAVCKSSDDPSGVTLIADLQVHGIWQPQVDVLFDVHVVETDAPTYCNHSPQIVLRSAEAVKKQKYLEACLACYACFTPLCFSIDGMLGTEADIFIRRWADKLSTKWERPYSAVAGWVRSRLSFALLHAIMLCVRGLRTKHLWRSLEILNTECIY